MDYTFQQLFDVSNSQQLVNSFARASGLGIIVADPDGRPIIMPSNVNPLCRLILNTESGRRDCRNFIALLSRRHGQNSQITSCMAGLRTSTTSMTVEGRHIAILLTGQVLNVGQDIASTLAYCKSIGVDESICRKAVSRTRRMTETQFTHLYDFINKNGRIISKLALRSLQQREIIKKNTAMESLLAKEKEFFQTTINSIGDAVITMNMDGIVMSMNNAAESLTVSMKQDAIHRHFSHTFTLLHEKTHTRFKSPVKETLKKGVPVASEAYLLRGGDGSTKHIAFNCSPIQNANGRSLGAVLVFRDISASKKQAEKMEYLSYHDSLTGLYNRVFFEQACESMQRKNIVPVSIIMGDANGLKHTNDIYGHAAGDILLKTIADAFKNACRSDDVVARWGGDEFTAALPGLTNKRAKAITRDIHRYCAAALTGPTKASVALGVATKEFSETSLADMLKRAEKKMYRAKQNYKRKQLSA